MSSRTQFKQSYLFDIKCKLWYMLILGEFSDSFFFAFELENGVKMSPKRRQVCQLSGWTTKAWILYKPLGTLLNFSFETCSCMYADSKVRS